MGVPGEHPSRLPAARHARSHPLSLGKWGGKGGKWGRFGVGLLGDARALRGGAGPRAGAGGGGHGDGLVLCEEWQDEDFPG